MKKMRLQSLITSSLTSRIAIFEKGTCQPLHPFYRPHFVCKIYYRKIEVSQLSNYVSNWNAQKNPISKNKTTIWVK